MRGSNERKKVRFVAWGIGAALILAVIALCVNPCPANDLFWQLRMGRDICQTGQPPRFDAYSWTRQGAPCVMHEWLTFVLLWKAYSWGGGFAGVWLMQVLLTAAAFGLLFTLLLRETEGAPLTAFVLAVAAAIAAAPFFQPRPHLFTYLFLTATVGLILHVRRQPKRWRRLWYLPPLFALWANLHAGVLVGIGVLALSALGDMAEACLEKREKRLRRSAYQRRASRFVGVAVVCVAATLLNPYGWHLYQNFVATLGNKAAMDTVVEWASPDFHALSGKLVEGIGFILACGLAFSQRRRRVAPVVITLVLAHAALMAYRNVPLFALVGLLVTARHLQSALCRLPPSAGGRALFGSAPPVKPLALVAGAVAAIFMMNAARQIRNAPETAGSLIERTARATVALNSFPERACRFLETLNLPATARLYNDYGIGGYLIWRLPQHPVFIDGRADLYFERVLDEYLEVHKLAYSWRDVIARYNPEVVLLSTNTAQARLFLSAPEWKLVYADDLEEGQDGQALVFVRRLSHYAHLPEKQAVFKKEYSQAEGTLDAISHLSRRAASAETDPPLSAAHASAYLSSPQ